MNEKQTSTEKSRRRYAALQQAAERNGWPNWSAMLTAIKNGQALVVRVAEKKENPAEPVS